MDWAESGLGLVGPDQVWVGSGPVGRVVGSPRIGLTQKIPIELTRHSAERLSNSTELEGKRGENQGKSRKRRK